MGRLGMGIAERRGTPSNGARYLRRKILTRLFWVRRQPDGPGQTHGVNWRLQIVYGTAEHQVESVFFVVLEERSRPVAVQLPAVFFGFGFGKEVARVQAIIAQAETEHPVILRRTLRGGGRSASATGARVLSGVRIGLNGR